MVKVRYRCPWHEIEFERIVPNDSIDKQYCVCGKKLERVLAERKVRYIFLDKEEKNNASV